MAKVGNIPDVEYDAKNGYFEKKSRRATLPEEVVDDVLQLDENDEIEWLYHEGDDYAIARRAPRKEKKKVRASQVFQKKTVLQKMGLSVIAVLAVVTLFPHAAFAQPPPTNSTYTNPAPIIPSSQQCPASGDVMNSPMTSLVLSGPNGYVPLQLILTYPSGTNDTSSTAHSPNDVITTQISEAPGITTKTTSTSSIDNFQWTFGEHYPYAMINQVATLRIIANNTLVLSNFAVPITTCDFRFQLSVGTSVPPHIPTAQELNGPILNSLADVKATELANSQKLDGLVVPLQEASNALQAGIAPQVLGSVGTLAAAVVAWKAYNTIRTRKAEIKPAKKDATGFRRLLP